MTPATIFAVCVASFWSLLFLLNHLLSKYAPHWSQKLHQHGIIHSYVFLGIETDVFTPYIVSFATRWRKLVHFWFLVGAFVGVACFVLTLTYLLPSYLLRTLWPHGESPTVEVQMIIPGLTVPWEYVPHLMLAIFLTLAFHELGHALSGANDNKAIQSIGIGLQLFVPSAYVQFRENHYDLSPWRQLKVYCAGAWHNWVLYVMAYLVITYSSQIFGVAFERHEKGQLVTSIRFNAQYSPIKVGDTIVGLNEYTIGTLSDWNEALEKVFLQTSNDSYYPAVCVPTDWIPSEKTRDVPECCTEEYEGAIPCWREAKKDGTKFCRPAKEVWALGVTYCRNTTTSPSPTCPNNQMRCAMPDTAQKYAQFGLKLMQIRVLRGGSEVTLLHVRQHPLELQQQVTFEMWMSRWKWMPNWADQALIVCELLMSFNFITPIISLLPIVAFDGEYVLYALTVWLAPKMDEDLREKGISWTKNTVSAIGAILGLFSMYKALF